MTATVTDLAPRTTPDTPVTPRDIANMAASFTAAGITPDKLLELRDTPLSRAVAARMRAAT